MEMAEGRLISPWMNPGALRRHLVKVKYFTTPYSNNKVLYGTLRHFQPRYSRHFQRLAKPPEAFFNVSHSPFKTNETVTTAVSLAKPLRSNNQDGKQQHQAFNNRSAPVERASFRKAKSAGHCRRFQL